MKKNKKKIVIMAYLALLTIVPLLLDWIFPDLTQVIIPEDTVLVKRVLFLCYIFIIVETVFLTSWIKERSTNSIYPIFVILITYGITILLIANVYFRFFYHNFFIYMFVLIIILMGLKVFDSRITNNSDN